MERRLQLYDVYITPILTYNVCTWALTEAELAELEACRRRHLRRIIGIYYPSRISNANLYKKCNMKELETPGGACSATPFVWATTYQQNEPPSTFSTATRKNFLADRAIHCHRQRPRARSSPTRSTPSAQAWSAKATQNDRRPSETRITRGSSFKMGQYCEVCNEYASIRA